MEREVGLRVRTGAHAATPSCISFYSIQPNAAGSLGFGGCRFGIVRIGAEAARGAGQLLDAIDRAELVAVGITHIGQVHGAQASVAQARRVFDRLAAVCKRVVSWNSRTCSGELHLKPMVPPLAKVAGSLLIGSVTQNVLPLCR